VAVVIYRSYLDAFGGTLARNPFNDNFLVFKIYDFALGETVNFTYGFSNNQIIPI